jgi:anti-anti-sigma factor
MEIGEKRHGDVVVISPVGRIDNDTSPAFQDKLLPCVDVAGAKVIVDLAGIEYISSAGLRALMMAAKRSKAQNGQLSVAALTPIVQEIFAISRFSHVVKVVDTLENALTALG